MSNLELNARVKIRPGQLDGFKRQAAEIMRQVREKDTHTLRYDWFISEDGLHCEVHEIYPDEQGLLEHNLHILEARAAMFRDFAYDHRMYAFAEVSPQLRGLAEKHAGGINVFPLFQGLDVPAHV